MIGRFTALNGRSTINLFRALPEHSVHCTAVHNAVCTLLTRTLSPSLNFSCRMEINVGFIWGGKVKGTVA
jgi:hypothetical protein